ncbi:DUF898 domain-containing protein [Pontibacter sp. JH31]|uniref:DUF898 domain-containing protein n=1 Tax=Pontibacter aquaedesilientis TaxID=2766980 RepID=A0ABR7XHY8_9BACT|nr:DUF898 family protein [Pontibacter aquaedesilientis]MBD1397909.1 DUF898 domain-containing protein [Pontibacter aquaedesilientis]
MTTTLLEKEKQTKSFTFTGRGSDYFAIEIVNFLLTVVTLGLYYPWAKAKSLQYLYRKTELAGTPFVFHGTGKEMFVGFIKGLGVFISLYSMLFFAALSTTPFISVLFVFAFIVGVLILIPVALHGMMRYRTSRTSWRGIHMGYRGELSDMVTTYLVGFFLTVFTLGIYGSWFVVKLRKQMIDNVRFGNASLRYVGDGADLFLINLKGYFLSVFTLGIYFFWFTKNLLHFYVNNIVVLQDDGTYSRLKCHVSGWEVLKLTVGNIFIVLFTLGLGIPLTTTRTLSLIMNSIVMSGDFDADALVQTEEAYDSAMYESMSDMMDIGVI